MKKLIYCALALAAGLFATSCMQENLEPVQGGSTVTYTVNVPEVATKAIGDAQNVNNLVYAVYRVTGENEATAKANLTPEKFVYQATHPVTNGKSTISLELINNQAYLVLFWAQVGNTWFADDYQFGTKKVAYPANLVANDDKYSAFYGVSYISDVQGPATKDITLHRPFAQINIAANDPQNYNVKINKASVTVANAASGFDVAKEEAIVTADYSVSFAAAPMPVGEKLTVNNVTYETGVQNTGSKENDKHHYVAMNYVFAADNVNVSYVINTDHGDVSNTITNVPVAKNYRTNIVGDLLTSDVKYNVTLDQDWGPAGDVDDDYVVEVVSVASAEDLQEAIENIQTGTEGNIKLEGNIDLVAFFAASTQAVTKSDNAALPIVIPAEKTMTLDLNGFTITTPWESETDGKHYYAFDNRGTLKIVDSKATGKIVARGIFNYGKMTLESGTIKACDGNGGYGVRNYEGAEFVMNGGTVATIYEDGDIPGEGYDASPIRVDEGAKAVINGGIINNVSNFTVAIDNYGETIVNDGTFTSVHTTLANSATMTINGGSFTCNGLEGITAHALWAAAGRTTINGGTFNGKDNYNGFNVDASKGATVYIKGGEFLPVHSGSLYGDGSIIVTGGTFFDEVSEKYLAVGYSCQQNEEEKWIIRECPVRIGEAAYYATLAKAVAAVQEGETITILAGKTLEEGTVKLPAALKNVTFKGEEGATLKDMTIMAHDGSSISYEGLTFDGITFENSRLSFTGWRTGRATVKDFIITNCVFTKLNDTTNSAPIHFNMAETEPVNGLTFTNNVIDGATGGSKSGIYAQVTGEVLVSGNIINNVSFRPYVIQVTTDDNVADNFVVINNTFSGSAVGRAQGLGNNAEGTDAVNIVVTENIFKGITDAQQICYWNFNPETTTADLSHNYYDIDILENPGKIYYNSAAANVYDLLDMGVFPIYTDEAKTTTFSPEVSAAKIGETEYATLQEAFNAGGNITLLHNITVDETVVLSEDVTVVLDLNGKTLAAADKNVVKNNGGNLTIKNGTITRTGDEVGYSVNNASGEIVVENATVQRGLYTSGSKLTATNANISHEQSTRHAIYAWNCEVTINSGTFHNGNAGNATLMASGSSVVTINGGTFSIADGRSSLGWTSSMIDQNSTAQVLVKGGLFNGGFRINSADTKLTIEGGEFNTNNGSAFTDYSGTKVVKGGKFTDAGAQNWAKKYLADGYILAGDEVKKAYVVNDAASLIETITNAEAGAYIVVENALECTETVSLPANSTLALNADVTFTTLKAVSGATITIQDGKTLTLNDFSFGSKDAADAEYEIKGGTVKANYGFFQHGEYSLYSTFETGYMYYSYGSDITVYGTFHSQGKGDGLDYVRGKLTIAKGGKSIHDKSLWVGQPASWGAMNASLVIEDGGYVQANSLSVYEGSSLTYSNDADLKYNSVTGTEYITKK